MDASLDAVRAQRSHWVSALDFDGLKAFAREGFEAQKTREGAFYPRLMRDAMEALAVEVARQNIDLGALEWRDLERLLAAVFQGLGYRCILTPGSKDGGRDLVLCDITQDDVAWYNIELKHWRGRSVTYRG